jgi:hypothetical protein
MKRGKKLPRGRVKRIEHPLLRLEFRVHAAGRIGLVPGRLKAELQTVLPHSNLDFRRTKRNVWQIGKVK